MTDTPDTRQLDWNKMDGLLPAIVQDIDDGRVLMLGYMNQAALRQTLDSGKVTFFSRSRQGLWTKGETSGNWLQLKAIGPDCDNDALLVQARPAGPVCHRGTDTCFGSTRRPATGFIGRLERVIESRRGGDPATSYTARLLDKGIRRCAQKVGEEGVEVALAAATGDREELIAESADLLYHLLVCLAAADTGLDAVVDALEQRHGGATGS